MSISDKVTVTTGSAQLGSGRRRVYHQFGREQPTFADFSLLDSLALRPYPSQPDSTNVRFRLPNWREVCADFRGYPGCGRLPMNIVCHNNSC